MSRVLGAVIVSSFCLAKAACAATVALAVPIGNPTYAPTGFVLFSAPIGTPDDGFAEFAQSEQAVLPSPNYQYNPNTGEIVSGTPRSGPYDNDFPSGVAAAGFHTGPTFTANDFSNGNAVFLAFLFVPSGGAPVGSSPDYSSGPIIQNSLFPLQQNGLTSRNAVDYDPYFDGSYGNVNDDNAGLGRPNYDGFSHMPVFEAESSVFGPDPTDASKINGSYVSTFRFIDTAGNGYAITTSYVVVPEPITAVSIATLGVLAVLMTRTRRQSTAVAL